MFNLSSLQQLIATYWTHVAVAVFPFAIYLMAKQWKRQSSIAHVGQKAITDSDARMVGSAIARGLDEAQSSYLSNYIAPDLAKLTAEGLRAKSREKRVGLVALICTPISSAITGVGIAIPGVANTIQLSFAVTSIGTMAAAVLIFFGWAEKGVQKNELARKIRDEIWQFTAGACEYRGQSIDQAWNLLTSTLSEWIFADITAESRAMAKARQAQPDKAETDSEE